MKTITLIFVLLFLNSFSNLSAQNSPKFDGTDNSVHSTSNWVAGESLVQGISTSSVTITSCGSYLSPSGNYTWSTSGTYYDTIPSASGADSVITINLTVYITDTSVSQSGITLTANANAYYQWINCNGDIIINGANGKTFTATTNGSYAVIVTNGICFDTSSCYQVTGVGIQNNINTKEISIYPNPCNSLINIKLPELSNNLNINIADLSGKIVLQKNFKNSQNVKLNVSELSTGIYLLSVRTDSYTRMLKISVE